MSDRAEFEKSISSRFPGMDLSFDATGEYAGLEACQHWETWQAARAQGGQGAEPVITVTNLHTEDSAQEPVATMSARDWLRLSQLPPGTKLYTHSQPAQQGVPEWMAEISSNLKTQDNRITADPLFVVFQKREIVVAEDYDHDRIAWVGDEGQEPDAETAETLDDLRDDVHSDWWAEDEITLTDDDDGEMEWRRLALKTVDEFVTACFTEAGAKYYLKANGHNLRLPHIYVTSLYRNEEMKQLRDWLLAAAPQPPQEGA